MRNTDFMEFIEPIAWDKPNACEVSIAVSLKRIADTLKRIENTVYDIGRHMVTK